MQDHLLRERPQSYRRWKIRLFLLAHPFLLAFCLVSISRAIVTLRRSELTGDWISSCANLASIEVKAFSMRCPFVISLTLFWSSGITCEMMVFLYKVSSSIAIIS